MIIVSKCQGIFKNIYKKLEKEGQKSRGLVIVRKLLGNRILSLGCLLLWA